MKNQSLQLHHTNTNLKIIARIKNIKEQQQMITQNQNTLIIKDVANRTSTEMQKFVFNEIFDEITTQQNVFDALQENFISKIIEGHNSCIIAYGPTNSGKSYTIFGENEKFSFLNKQDIQNQENDKLGLIPRTIEFLFNREKDLEEIREFVITCSIIEIYLDKIRDLGQAYLQDIGIIQNGSKYIDDNLEIYENTNGQIMVKKLSQIKIEKPSEIFQIIKSSFNARERYETKQQNLWQRSHTIFNINLVQKDKENDNLPFMNASLQFVDLAGSERIAKRLTSGSSFQDTILINSSLNTLCKCLLAISQASSKNIPYKESKLTRVLQNCLNSICHICFISHIDPHEKNFEECLSTLQFTERTTKPYQSKFQISQQEIDQQNAIGVASPFLIMENATEKLIKKVKEEVDDTRQKYQIMIKDQQQKFEILKQKLGLESEIDKIISRQSKGDINTFQKQREALQELEALKVLKRDYEAKIQRLNKQLDENIHEDYRIIEKNIAQLIENKEQNKKLKEQQSIISLNQKDIQDQFEQEKKLEKIQMKEHHLNLKIEKENFLVKIPIQTKLIQNNSQQSSLQNQSQLLESHFIGYIQSQYKTMLEDYIKEQGLLTKNIQEQYEFFLKKKNNQLDLLVRESKKYQKKKNNEQFQIQNEMLDIYDVINKQQKIIEKINEGRYSSGNEVFKISNEDIPELPDRVNHPFLFIFLDKTHLQNIEKQKSQIMKENNKNEKDLFESCNSLKVKNDKKFDGKRDISKIGYEELKIYAEQIKNFFQESIDKFNQFKSQIKQFNYNHSHIDINNLQKELLEYKRLCSIEEKRQKEIQTTLQSQQRLIGKNFFIEFNKLSCLKVKISNDKNL